MVGFGRGSFVGGVGDGSTSGVSRGGSVEHHVVEVDFRSGLVAVSGTVRGRRDVELLLLPSAVVSSDIG